MIYLYLFGTCFHFIYVFMIIGNIDTKRAKNMERRMMLAVKIAEGIKRKGLSQKEFAEKMSKRPSEISKWLRGDHNFTTSTLFDMKMF